MKNITTTRTITRRMKKDQNYRDKDTATKQHKQQQSQQGQSG